MKLLLDNWNPDDTRIPPVHYDSLCRFNYMTEKNKAEAYRIAEVPFITYNHPEVNEVTTSNICILLFFQEARNSRTMFKAFRNSSNNYVLITSSGGAKMERCGLFK
jgi:hypothetical protein